MKMGNHKVKLYYYRATEVLQHCAFDFFRLCYANHWCSTKYAPKPYCTYPHASKKLRNRASKNSLKTPNLYFEKYVKLLYQLFKLYYFRVLLFISAHTYDIELQKKNLILLKGILKQKLCHPSPSIWLNFLSPYQ